MIPRSFPVRSTGEVALSPSERKRTIWLLAAIRAAIFAVVSSLGLLWRG